jgi:Kef-type K+ transport system membrane component KefB
MIVEVLAGAAVVLLAAKVGGELAERLQQPAVLGELAMGILLGNLPWGELLRHSQGLELLAEIGVVLLLFEVGLDSHLDQLLAVGWSATLVATVGVMAPMALGYGVSAWFLPAAPWYAHLFAGATLTATSVGITARVLKDLGRMEWRESRIILGAAVVDDVMGLVILAVVSGVVGSMGQGGGATLDWGAIAWIVAKSAGFLAGAILVGRHIHVNALKAARAFRVPGMTLVLAVCFCFALAALAGWMGLATIVGAFAAGLVLEDDDYAEFVKRGVEPIHDLVRPLTTVLVPIFFVMMGVKVDLGTFRSTEILGLAAAMTAAAVVGKQVCGLGVLDRGVSRLVVGIGMIPRGEVGLIFVGIGSQLGVFDNAMVSAMVVMVLLTTVMTPPLLKWSFDRATSSPA